MVQLKLFIPIDLWQVMWDYHHVWAARIANYSAGEQTLKIGILCEVYFDAFQLITVIANRTY